MKRQHRIDASLGFVIYLVLSGVITLIFSQLHRRGIIGDSTTAHRLAAMFGLAALYVAMLFVSIRSSKRGGE